MKTRTLAQLRQDTGLSQQELADEIGVSQPTVSGWELGLYKPDSSRWAKLAIAVESDILTMVRMWT
jgi:transcriptional regulator with XRE-family HTH domain